MKTSFSLLSRILSFQPRAAAGHAGSRYPQSPLRPWEGDVSRARLGPELASSHVSCWSWLPAGRDVPARVLIKSSWRSPGSVTIPTCIWLALEKGAKFLQHKDQSVSICQALNLGAEAGQRHDWVSLPGCCAVGGLPPLLGSPAPTLSHWGAAPGAPLVHVLVRLCFFPSPTLTLFVCPLVRTGVGDKVSREPLLDILNLCVKLFMGGFISGGGWSH